jgi:3-hydroxybutyryl-CoA dehydratase
MSQMGKTFDEIRVGDAAQISKTITETDIVLYAGLTGDFNPMHVDAEFAKKTHFGERVAHGPISLGLIAPVIGMQLPGPGCILLSLTGNFRAPVKIGDTVTARAEVAEKLAEKKTIRLALSFTNQRGEEVISGEAMVSPTRARS